MEASPELVGIIRKLRGMQTTLTRHTEMITDHETRITDLETLTAGLVIPRRASTGAELTEEEMETLEEKFRESLGWTSPHEHESPEIRPEELRELAEALPPYWTIRRIRRVGIIRPRIEITIERRVV